MPRRALLLVNRNARQGQQALGQARDLLRAAGLELAEEEPARDERLADVIHRHRNRVDLVIVGGGDGTLNSVVDALVAAQLPLGILPLGTANDLARTLGLPLELPAACAVIARHHTRRIDLGSVNGKHFFNVASLGLSVQITRGLTHEIKSRWGVFAYLLVAARAVWGARPFRAEIRDGQQTYHVKTVQVAVGNGRHYGGGMTVVEDAAIDDGRLDLYSLEVQRWWQIVPLLWAMRRGTLAAWPQARTSQGTAFDIVLRRPRRVNTDGELTLHTAALQFRLVPQALSVVVPEPGT